MSQGLCRSKNSSLQDQKALPAHPIPAARGSASNHRKLGLGFVQVFYGAASGAVRAFFLGMNMG